LRVCYDRRGLRGLPLLGFHLTEAVQARILPGGEWGSLMKKNKSGRGGGPER